MEINAISNYYKCNVVVFQDRRPNLELQNYPDNPRVLQLAYFGSCHYNSVRGKQQIALSTASSRDNIVLRKEEDVVVEKRRQEVEERKRVIEEERREMEEEKRRAMEEEKRKRVEEEKRRVMEEEKRKRVEEKRRKVEEKRRKVEEEERRRVMEERRRMEEKRKEEEERRRREEERRIMEEERRQVEERRRAMEEEERRKEKTEEMNNRKQRRKEGMSSHELVTRNFMILKEVEKRVAKDHHHHHHHGEWCGDLPFNSLIEPVTQSKLLWIENERQLRTVLHFLTMKCPCGSGSYFKYCCYPKMKAWLVWTGKMTRSDKRKRYYLSKFRV